MRSVRSYLVGGDCFFAGVSGLSVAGERQKTRARRVFYVAGGWIRLEEKSNAGDGRSRAVAVFRRERISIAVGERVSTVAVEQVLAVAEAPAAIRVGELAGIGAGVLAARQAVDGAEALAAGRAGIGAAELGLNRAVLRLLRTELRLLLPGLRLDWTRLLRLGRARVRLNRANLRLLGLSRESLRLVGTVVWVDGADLRLAGAGPVVRLNGSDLGFAGSRLRLTGTDLGLTGSYFRLAWAGFRLARANRLGLRAVVWFRAKSRLGGLGSRVVRGELLVQDERQAGRGGFPDWGG